MRTAVVIALSGAVAGAAPPTIYDNYQTFPIGSRAAGMGGAYTALACDEGALTYNPAALACSSESHLELAANAYVLQSINIPNAIGTGADVSATTYHSIPSIVGGVRILADGDKETSVGRLAFGLSASVPQSIAVRVDPNATRLNTLSLSVRDDLTAADLGLGYQLTRSLAIGVSIGGALRTFESHGGLLLAQPATACPNDPSSQCVNFVAQSVDTDELAIGARAKVGARLRLTDAVSLGLAIASPSVHIYGTAKSNQLTTAGLSTMDAAGKPIGAFGAFPVRVAGSSQLALPLRIAFGAAWSSPDLTISIDLSVNFPRTVKLAYNLKPETIDGAMPVTAAIPDHVIHPVLQPNANLGAEIRLSQRLALDLGVFTDLSSVSREDRDLDLLDRVHMFGGSIALGILGRQSRGWFGASFEGGVGTSLVRAGDFSLPAELAGMQQMVSASYTRWTIAGIIGSNYAFLPDEAPKGDDAIN
jgi:hypothetical protein